MAPLCNLHGQKVMNFCLEPRVTCAIYPHTFFFKNPLGFGVHADPGTCAHTLRKEL